MSGFEWPEGKRGAVSVTFDDARATQVDAGVDILGKSGVRATFYVSPTGVEKNIDGWRRIAAAGHEIGNHTMTHPCSGNFGFSRGNALEDFTLEKMAARELDAANDYIERTLGVKAETFAYPCGQKFVGRGRDRRSYAPLVAERFLAGRSAFDETSNDPHFCDLSTAAGINADGARRDALKEMADDAAARGRWLIIFAHDIAPKRTQAIEPRVLEEFCGYVTGAGLWVATVAQAAGHIIRERQRLGAP